jgi:hypothetical protein
MREVPARHDRDMQSILETFRGNGLFLRRRDLLALGHSDAQIRNARRGGVIMRARQGWYCPSNAPPDAIRAVRVGGRLTGLSALKSYGHWTPETEALHVTVPADARALRSMNDMRVRRKPSDNQNCVVSWTDRAAERFDPCAWRVPVVDALVHVLRTAERVTAIVCLDAALHASDQGLEGITSGQLEEIFARAPQRVQSWRYDVDGRAGAGGETEFRLRCQAAGLPFLPQPFLPGVGHADGQIGPHTYVEIDGGSAHDNFDAIETDRDRDAKSTVLGTRTLRIRYRMFRGKWHLCEAMLRQALAEDLALAKTTVKRYESPRWQAQKGSLDRKVRRFVEGRGGHETSSGAGRRSGARR